MRSFFILQIFITFLFVADIHAQPEITLDDIWSKGLFFGESFEGLAFTPDDAFYTYLDYNQEKQTLDLVKTAVAKEDKRILIPSSVLISPSGQVVPESYEFSPGQQKVLLLTDKDRIYRRSFTAAYFIYDIGSGSLKPLSAGGKQSYATFSPDGTKVAFVRGNNIFIKEISTDKEVQVTLDGALNKIINGSTDWVYEEEFEFTKGFFWSPDSKTIAYYKFDESEVKEYSMQVWQGLYPVDYKYKYPKAGEKNALVSIHCYNVATGKTSTIPLNTDSEFYIPRIQWTENPELLSIQKLNRRQNHLQILHANISSGVVKTAYEEKNNTYVEINDNLRYLKDRKSFLLTSEKDGFRHIYHYSMDGSFIRQITHGQWEVSNFLGIDETNQVLYFTSSEISPLEKHLFRIDLSGNRKKRLTEAAGTHEITASPKFSYFIDEYSATATPPLTYLLEKDGKQTAVLQENEVLKETIKAFEFAPLEFMEIPVDKGLKINASILKPKGFSEKKKYPVLVYLYGGPGSQQVVNHWSGPDHAWFQMLAQKGILVVTIDNRGTGGRGASFKKITQHQLGKYETEDLISSAKFLGNLPFVDKNRIGVFGWSFGGYMSALGMTIGADYFKTGIAVAPVISWRFYDSIYTERFLGDPKENKSGYDDNSPLTHASKLKGNFLLIHGTADDNVHVQNSLEMEKALIQANKQFTSFHYPDKNHSLYGGNTRLHLYTMMTDFLLKNL